MQQKLPTYSFAKNQSQPQTTSIFLPKPMLAKLIFFEGEKPVRHNYFLFVSLLLSAYVQRVSVSHMWDFCLSAVIIIFLHAI